MKKKKLNKSQIHAQTARVAYDKLMKAQIEASLQKRKQEHPEWFIVHPEPKAT